MRTWQPDPQRDRDTPVQFKERWVDRLTAVILTAATVTVVALVGAVVVRVVRWIAGW